MSILDKVASLHPEYHIDHKGGFIAGITPVFYPCHKYKRQGGKEYAEHGSDTPHPRALL